MKGIEGEARAPTLRVTRERVEGCALVTLGAVVIVGGRRLFGGSGVGRDWVGQRREELDGCTVDYVFRAEEREERGRMFLL